MKDRCAAVGVQDLPPTPSEMHGIAILHLIWSDAISVLAQQCQ